MPTCGRGRAAPGLYPLAPNQEALWFLHRFKPGHSAYNIAVAYRARALPPDAAMQAALQAMVARHGALRTTFEERDGRPYQRVHEAGSGTLQVVDATGWSADRFDAQLAALANQPFDLERGPLGQVYRIVAPDGQVLILLVLHHIIADGWSLALLRRDVFTAPGPAPEGHDQHGGTEMPRGREDGARSALAHTRDDIPLAPRPAPYSDFVAWQAAQLDGPEGERQRRYWHARLAGALAPLDLPIDRPRPSVQSLAGAAVQFSIERDSAERLNALARAHGCTMFMAFLSLYQTLLHRITGQREILIGVPVSNRTEARFDETFGFITNTLVLRASIGPGETFATLLAANQRSVLEALEHQHYPFRLLVEQLVPIRDPSRPPLVQVEMALEMTRWQGAPAGARGGTGDDAAADAPVVSPNARTVLSSPTRSPPGLPRPSWRWSCARWRTPTPARSPTAPRCSRRRRYGAWQGTFRPCWPGRSRTPIAPSSRCRWCPPPAWASAAQRGEAARGWAARPSAPSTRCSRSRSPGRPRRSPCWALFPSLPRDSTSPTASSTREPSGWPGSCAPWAWGRRSRWASTPNATWA